VNVLRAAENTQVARALGRLMAVLALTIAALAVAVGSADAAAVKSVRYDGYRVTVPARWPVFRIGSGSRTCVRFNRHALYLGTPSSAQRCPSDAVGRTESILISPRRSRSSTARVTTDVAHAAATPSPAQPLTGSETQLTRGAVQVTATWAAHPAVIRRALGVSRLTRTATPTVKARRMSTRMRAQARAAAVSRATGTVYTGKGFDACSTPSQGQMNAWAGSPYRSLGVYIGGANSACAQPNLNSTWMGTQWASGWHVIPIYVGLQAPSNSCGCRGIAASQASAQGTAAATDAVAHAQAVGIGAGNPIYFDMEGYSRTSSNTNAVLSFLAAWTTQLHADGYGSGVYSSADSGVADLVAKYGTGYAEPDDIWFARWNGSASTSDSAIPATDWPSHQRLHQYSGAHNETYGGVTINIDSDYVDGATAFGAVTPAAAPALSVVPQATGKVNLSAGWAGISGIASWRTLGGSSPSALNAVDTTPARGNGSTTIAERNVFPYYAVQALDANGQLIGTSATTATRPHVALFGRSVFVPSAGPAGVPAGCFTGGTCAMSVTVYSGRRLIARTGPERLRAGTGLLFFKLTSAGRRLLRNSRNRRLPVSITARDLTTGRSARTNMNLVPYATVGKGPGRSSRPGGSVWFVGLRDFVLRSHTGGILAGCSGATACLATVKITAGHRTVASTGRRVIGAHSLAYLSYRLTGYGAGLVAKAKGNQLGALVTVTSQSGLARGHLALLNYR
jgi:hypothetical protein